MSFSHQNTFTEQMGSGYTVTIYALVDNSLGYYKYIDVATPDVQWQCMDFRLHDSCYTTRQLWVRMQIFIGFLMVQI